MLNPARYGVRSTAFDKIISATHDHFWDPLDKKYIDFSTPFDTSKNTILPERFFPIFHTKIGDRMTAEQKIKFANESTRWQLSAILHGEQGALALGEAVTNGHVSDAVHAEAKKQFDDHDYVEICVVAAFYAMVGRMLDAMGVQLEPEMKGFSPELP